MSRKSHSIILFTLGSLLILATDPALAASGRPGGTVIYQGSVDGGQLVWERDSQGRFVPTLPGARPLTETDKPVLVRQSLLILVPLDAPIVDVEVVPLQSHRESLPGPLGLGSPLISDQGHEVPVDRLAVGEKSYPLVWGEYAGSHTWRGFRCISVRLYPLRLVRDAPGQWTAVEILDRFEIRALTDDEFVLPDVAQRQRFVPGEHERAEQALARVVANPEALPGYQRADGVMVPEPVGGFQPTRAPTLNGSAVSYLIITSDEMADVFQVLADLRTAQGLPSVVATVEWIEANFRNGCDRQETMRMFIREAYEKWGVSWVLLGGDTGILPARYVTSTYYPATGHTDIPADLYFACLDGNWNADGDYVFGEPFTHPLYPGDECDLLDEVYIGRAPVSSVTAASVFVGKVIQYGQASAASSWTNEVLFAAEVLFPADWSQGVYIVLDGAMFADSLMNNYINPCTDMSTARMYENFYDYPGSVQLTREALIDSLNTGHFGIVNQIGHGFYFNMSVGNANFTNADADGLVNPNPFVIYALNCASAAFDKACLMERFIQNPNGGAVAAVGSARAAFPHTSNGYQEVFFEYLYCQEANRLGELISLSRLPFIDETEFNTVHRWTYMNYTLLGDPTMAVWTAVTSPVQITAPTSLPAGAQSVTITVQAEGSPVAGASVCLSKPGDDYQHDLTDALGQVVLPFMPTSGGEALLIVTGTNLESTQTTLSVNVGAVYVAVTGMQLDDDGSVGSAGNGNHVAEAGETVALYLECEDTGGGGAAGCTATLTTTLPGVIILDGTADVGDIPAGGLKTANEPFLVSLDPTLADGTHVDLMVVVTDDDSNDYQNDWVLTVKAPELEPVALDWEDVTFGDGNGVITDGERVAITVSLKNFGLGIGDYLTGTLRTVDPAVTLHDSVVIYEGISFLDLTDGESFFSLADADVVTDSWCWILYEDNYGRTFRHDFHLQPPTQPLGLEADSSEGPDIIALRWLPNQDDFLRGYHIYRGNAPDGPFTRVNSDLVDGVSYFRDTNLQPLTQYFYRTTAVDSSLVEGTPSEAVSKSTAPPEADGFPLPFARETSGHFAVGDVTGDGRLEIVLGADEIYVWRDDGSELFDGDNNAQTHGPITGLDGDFQPAGLALAQLDGLPGLEIVVGNGEFFEEMHVFRADGTELPGWPKSLETPGASWNWATPAVGDVDGDGTPEIVVNTLNGRTWVWHADGTELVDGDNDPATDGVFIERPEALWEWSISSPALFDLDGDGAKEIIFGTKLSGENSLLAYRYDGTQADGFPYSLGNNGKVFCSPAIADLNHDGIWEIILHTRSNFLHVVQQDGTPYPGFPISFISNAGDSPLSPSEAVGDFDGDGELEILAVSTRDAGLAELFIFDTDINGGTSGQPLPGWPQSVPGATESSPVVGDIDGDGVPDVIHGIGGISEDSPDNLYAFKASGEAVNGFPIGLDGSARCAAVICDLDRDGDVDLVHGSWGRLIHVWDMPFDWDMTKVPWPTFSGHMYRDGVYRDPTVVDVPPDPRVVTVLHVEPPYPNPFNPSTTVKLFLPGVDGATGPLQVVVYDLQGRKVRILHDGPARSGWHTWVWDGRNGTGRNQASGIYFLRARSGEQTVIHKMSLIK